MSDPDYPLTWPQALRAAKEGAIIECANTYRDVHQRGYYDPARGVLMDDDFDDEVLWLASDDVDAGWRIVGTSNKEVQP